MIERIEISKEETVTIQRMEPSREEITNLAYGLYLRRCRAPGKDVEDWLSAQKKLEQRSPCRTTENQGCPGRPRLIDVPGVNIPARYATGYLKVADMDRRQFG